MIEAWVQRYSNLLSNSTDQAFKAVIDQGGDVIVAGYTDDGTSGRDMLIIKFSGTDGSVVWQRRYDGPGRGDDEARAIALDRNGNVVVTGPSYNGTNSDYLTAKYAAADGIVLWEKRYNSSANDNDASSAIAINALGNVTVTGFSYSSSTNSDYLTIQYSGADGALLWERRYDGPANRSDEASALAVQPNGDVVVTGYSIGNESSLDYYTARYTTAGGAIVWEQRYNDQANGWDSAQAIAVDERGDVVVTGFVYENPNGFAYHTLKYAGADGALVWERRHNGSVNGIAPAIAVDGSGNVVVAGTSNSNITDYYTVKYRSSDGTIMWEQHYDGPRGWMDVVQAVAVDRNGNAIVTGYSSAADASDYYTAKYAALDGALIWEQRHSGPTPENDYGQAVAVDVDGSVVVTGVSWQPDADWYTAKYAALEGTLVWEHRYDALAHNNVLPTAIAVDDRGNVAVAASGYYTAKYRASDGNVIWEHRYNSPVNRVAYPTALAIDGSGNVVVTGYSYADKNTYSDYYTAKYAAANGALLWERRHHGSIPVSDRAEAVTVDKTGNVFVTGTSAYDYYTVKYASEDGAVIWEKRYNSGGQDESYAIAVDPKGDAVVTGASSTLLGNSDYYTAKYAGADGTLLWERRYNGPASLSDSGRIVVLDVEGNAFVLGVSWDPTNSVYYIAKYAAVNGAILWEHRHRPLLDPYPYDYSYLPAVAVDRSGHVMVAGVFDDMGSGAGYHTVKYASQDGALLWAQRYSDTGRPRAIAVDKTDDAVIAGTSIASEGKSDYYIAKYAAADGSLLWETRFNGPRNENDYVLNSRSLALGHNGVIAVTGRSDDNLKPGYAYFMTTVVYWEKLPPISLELVSTGVRISMAALPARTYELQRAAAVTGPWSTIATITAPNRGLIDHVDTDQPTGSAFYRVRTP